MAGLGEPTKMKKSACSDQVKVQYTLPLSQSAGIRIIKAWHKFRFIPYWNLYKANEYKTHLWIYTDRTGNNRLDLLFSIVCQRPG